MPKQDPDLPEDEEIDDVLPNGRQQRPDRNGDAKGNRRHLLPKAKARVDEDEEDEREEDEDNEKPRTYKHSSMLLKLARHLGIPQEEIDETPSEDLQVYVRELLEQRREEKREAEARTPKAPEPDPDELDFEAEFPEGPVDPETGLPTKKKRKAKISDYDPGIQHLFKQNKELQKQLAAREKADAERARRQVIAMVDEAFAGFNDPELFGAGNYGELSEEDHSRRHHLVKFAGVEDGDTQRVVNQKLEKARNLIYGKKAKKAAEDDEELEERPAKKTKAARREERYRESRVARPTNRRTKDLPRGKEAAAEELRALMIEHGYDPGPRRNSDAEDTLPGDDD